MTARKIFYTTALLCMAVAAHAAGNMANLRSMSGKAPFFTALAGQLYKSGTNINPFLDSALPAPPKTVYAGPVFHLRHDYPKDLPPRPARGYPWQRVTHNGRITQKNAYAYVEALKHYVARDMRTLLFNYKDWNPRREKWWESIWLGSEREPIHGMYVGSGFPAGTLTGQKHDLTTYVLTMYNARAAKTLGNIWGTTEHGAMHPDFDRNDTQYANGSVIVKFSFVTACGSDWKPMQGTVAWPIYAPLNASNGSGHNPHSMCKHDGSNGSSTKPVMTNVYLMQFDIIVKDTAAAPQTGWVFSTLVYDKNAPGRNAWDKMVPLGATWGGNPKVVNLSPSALTPPAKVDPKLTENWINPKAPLYSKVTLGWDGRLSGPNDGAVVTPAWAGGYYRSKGMATAGCLACHSAAQYPMTSFLLPSSVYPPETTEPPLSSDPSASALVLAKPGSKQWMRWFQSNAGTTPMGPPTKDGKQPIALDYDMVTAFKAIPMWRAAVKAQQR